MRGQLIYIVLFVLVGTSLRAQSNRPPAEITEIRPLDRVVRKAAKPLDVIIKTPGDWVILDQIQVTTESGRASYAIPVSEIKSIVRRQSAAKVYENWQAWLVKNRRERKPRARAEFEFAKWCRTPLPENGGSAPSGQQALLHFEKAVRLDPELHEAYPYLVETYNIRASNEELSESALDREIETYMIAQVGGYESSTMNLRLGFLLAERLDEKRESVAYLNRVLADGQINAGQRRRARALLSEVLFELGDVGPAVAIYEGMIPPEHLLPSETFHVDRGTADSGVDGSTTGSTPESANESSTGAEDESSFVEESPDEIAERFEAYYRLARMRVRIGGGDNLSIAHGLFERAREIQPDFDPILRELAALQYQIGNFNQTATLLSEYLEHRPTDAEAQLDLALTHFRLGRFEDAEALLDSLSSLAVGTEEAVEEDSSVGASDSVDNSELGDELDGGDEDAVLLDEALVWRVSLLRGLIAEARGDDVGAIEAYRAATSGPSFEILPDLLLALAQMRSGDVSLAKSTIRELRDRFSERRDVFAAASRLLAGAELEARPKQAARLLEYAADVDLDDGALLERTALAFIHSGDLAKAGAFLATAHKLDAERAANLNGLGFLFYEQGDFDEAQRYFESTLTATKNSKTPEALAQRAYAQEVLVQITELQTLEQWVDGFDGADSQQIDGWDKSELFGISMSRRGESVAFRGTQKNSVNGMTELRLRRPIDSPSFDGLSVRVRIDSGAPQPMLRLEAPGSARRGAVGILITRDADGLVKPKIRTSAGSWKEPPQTTEESRTATVYSGGVPWPIDEEFHTFEIRSSGRKLSRGRYFDVYFDGQAVATELAVPDLVGAEYRAILAGGTDALGNQFAFTVDDLKILRRAKQK